MYVLFGTTKKWPIFAAQFRKLKQYKRGRIKL
jgi:hypothetical protein